MNKIFNTLAILLMFFALWLVGCEKSLGEGGTASIRGTVLIKVHRINEQVINSYLVKDQKVFLIVSKGTEFDSDTIPVMAEVLILTIL